MGPPFVCSSYRRGPIQARRRARESEASLRKLLAARTSVTAPRVAGLGGGRRRERRDGQREHPEQREARERAELALARAGDRAVERALPAAGLDDLDALDGLADELEPRVGERRKASAHVRKFRKTWLSQGY